MLLGIQEMHQPTVKSVKHQDIPNQLFQKKHLSVPKRFLDKSFLTSARSKQSHVKGTDISSHLLMIIHSTLWLVL